MLLSLKVKLPWDVRRLIGAFVPSESFRSWDSTFLIAIYDALEPEAWVFHGRPIRLHEGSFLLVDYLGAMQELVLNRNCIRIRGSKVLARALGADSTLRSLRIEGNNVGDAGAVEFADALRTNRTLQTLIFKTTGIGAAGATALAAALEHNDTLRNLSICNTSANEPDFDCDRYCYRGHSEEYRVCDVNKILKAGGLAFAAALRVNLGLLTLNLSDTAIDHVGAKAIAAALRHNSTLLHLDLSNQTFSSDHENYVGDDGALEFTVVLRVNSTLQLLDLNCTRIGSQGHQAIEKLLRNNLTSCRIIRTCVLGYVDVGHFYDDFLGIYAEDRPASDEVFDENWFTQTHVDDTC